ncbi:MAG: ribonuclease Y [Endomicrobiia bacterium]|nr:ribonuclease Y [Endomicrobiia bacterium]
MTPLNETYMMLIPAVFAVGAMVGYALRLVYSRFSLSSAEAAAKKIISEARLFADARNKDAILDAKEKIEKQRIEFERETREKKSELTTWEKRIGQREENLDRKLALLEKRERDIGAKEREVALKEKTLTDETRELERKKHEQAALAESIAGMTREEAKKALITMMEDEARKQAAATLSRIEHETNETAAKKSREILAVAIQRVAAEVTADITVSNVALSGDEIKGRIIGREGRNIRAFEQATGVDVIVDDTPETITLSSFDGVRREIARISLERLIADGRIHPARIEEVVNKVKSDMENTLREVGEKAALEAGVPGLPQEILKLLGKLKYRTSYGQNQLQHTIEVALVAGALGAELGADILFAKKAGLLHDLGKAVDHEQEGAHHQLSADIAKKYNESDKMINAILSHHEGISAPESVEAFILAAADAISAARPGARRESVANYIKRIEKLENLASSFSGVAAVFAVQAGREVRVLVEPDEISDERAQSLAKEIAVKVEQELDYPGQIKVTVIREVRTQEVAK